MENNLNVIKGPLFILFEGIDGSGKTTAAANLKNILIITVLILKSFQNRPKDLTGKKYGNFLELNLLTMRHYYSYLYWTEWKTLL
jgi:Na+-driven multidrug efflux pump